MRILYGVSGEGYGHSSRAKIIISLLQKKGHEVKVLTYGRAISALKDEFDVFAINGATIEFIENKLMKYLTLKKYLKMLKSNVKEWKIFHNLMKDFNPDLCITDMEPITAILRKIYHKPLISIDNQHRFTNLKLKISKQDYWNFTLTKNVVNFFVSSANYYIITSFKEYPPTIKNTVIVPPLIREDIKNLNPTTNNKILVYLSKKNSRFLNILKKLDSSFIIFGYDVNKKKKNLEFKTKEYFLKEVKACKAIISTAGFNSISEAIYLKKPFFAIPLSNHFEQKFNALSLKALQIGDYHEKPTIESIQKFLNNLNQYRLNLEKLNFDKNPIEKYLNKIIREIKNKI